MTYKTAMLIAKRQYALDVLAQAKGNQCEAARIAGVHRNTFDRIIESTGIRKITIRMMKCKTEKKVEDREDV